MYRIVQRTSFLTSKIDISPYMILNNYLILKAFAENDKTVGVTYDSANIVEAPAGFGATLAAALRDLADQLEHYHCDATAQDMRDPEKVKQTCFREHDKTLHRAEKETRFRRSE
jgi:hypothetical protein